MRAAASIAVKCVPLNAPGKYCMIDPPSGAPGLMEIVRTHIVSSDPSMGISTRLGHSYCRPRRPAEVKLDAEVQVFISGEVQIPMANS